MPRGKESAISPFVKCMCDLSRRQFPFPPPLQCGISSTQGHFCQAEADEQTYQDTSPVSPTSRTPRKSSIKLICNVHSWGPRKACYSHLVVRFAFLSPIDEVIPRWFAAIGNAVTVHPTADGSFSELSLIRPSHTLSILRGAFIVTLCCKLHCHFVTRGSCIDSHL